MSKRIFLLLFAVFVASGCIGSGQAQSSESFMDLREKTDSSAFKVYYSFHSQDSSADISYYNFEGREKYVSTRKTPGGFFETRTYLFDNDTVTCNEEPSPRGPKVHCSNRISDRTYRMLQLEELNLEQINHTGKASFNGRECEKFSANPGDNRLEVLESGESIGFCLDKEKGFVSSLNVSLDKQVKSSFTVENVSKEIDKKDVELERPVGIFPHCTDSYEIDITPFKDIDQAFISINGFNKTVDLPGKFETGVYSIPEENIEEGDNTLEIQVGEMVIEKSCYRRPS